MNENLLAGQFPQIKNGEVYADWIGAAISPAFLINSGRDYFISNLRGNPHSHHAPSQQAMDDVMEARSAILEYLNASPDEYEVIFTSGATAAIRILQHFKLDGGELLLTADNHNSINGLREDSRRSGAITRYSPLNDDLSLDEDTLDRMLRYPRSNGNKLFAYPAKSNYAGTIHSLDWVDRAQQLGWKVLLDTAAFLANSRIDLSRVKPDFMPISFYKLFGYPTGIGCLVVKKSAYEVLHKRWFAGGSILLVSVMKDFHAPESLGYARFEDGSINFAQIPLIVSGLKFMKDLGNIRPSIISLSTKLYDNLTAMEIDGNKIILHSAYGNDTITFSVMRDDRSIVDAWEFERFANDRGVFVRTGCFCNPGVNERVFGYEIETFERMYNDAIRPESISVKALREFSGGKPIGAIRASFGYANTIADVEKFTDVTSEFLSQL